MEEATRRAIEWDCAQSTARFYNHVDAGRFREAAEMFFDDGTWHRMEGGATGPDQIVKELEARDPNRVSMHLISNLTVRVIDVITAEVTANISACHAKPAAKGPATDAAIGGVMRTVEIWKKSGDCWKCADKKTQPLLRFSH
jgi:hypothetical protein